MRKAFADNLAKLSKPDAKELGARNRESGLQGVVQIYNEQLDTDTVPSGAAWIEPGDSVPQVMVKDQEGTTHHIPFGAGVPIGAVNQWAGTSDPAGGEWLICDGRTLSTSLYADLFAVCGTTWNTGGEAAGTFRIPDMRSRTPVGAGQGTGLSNRALGSTFGAENHTLGITEIPVHTHSGSTDSPSHGHSGSTDSPSHTHSGDGYISFTGAAQAVEQPGHNFYDFINTAVGTTGPSSHSHTLTINGTTHSHVLTIGNAGSGSSHNNMMPGLAMNFIVRAL